MASGINIARPAAAGCQTKLDWCSDKGGWYRGRQHQRQSHGGGRTNDRPVIFVTYYGELQETTQKSLSPSGGRLPPCLRFPAKPLHNADKNEQTMAFWS